MVLNNVKSCVTTMTGILGFDNSKFPIIEIALDGEEMPITDERISCMISTSNDKIDNVVEQNNII